MADPLYQPLYDPRLMNLDTEGIVRELMESATGTPNTPMSDGFLEALTGGNFPSSPYQPDSRQPSIMNCLTPPESVESRRATPTPTPSESHSSPLSVLPVDNFSSLHRDLSVPRPGPGTSSQPLLGPLDTVATVGGRYGSGARDRPRITSAQCDKASIEIMNPKQEYDKIQKKYGPKGKVSEQRIANGQVQMKIISQQPLSDGGIRVYVQREFEAHKKLKGKDPRTYGLGPIRLSPLDITPVDGHFPTYMCSLDLDSVFKTPDGREVYHLEKTQGWVYNRFQLQVTLTFRDGSHNVLVPYEFVLKSSRTPKGSSAANTDPRSRTSSVTNPLLSQSEGPSDAQHPRMLCYHLQAEFARIRNLEVEQIQTNNHDIAYYIKKKYPGESHFDEGDVVGFFEGPNGDTVIDLLTSENAQDARLAGVISRSAYLVGKAGVNRSEHDAQNATRLSGVINRSPFLVENAEEDDDDKSDADLVCIIGEIKVKVIGKVKTGELIYTCPNARFPGVATSICTRGNNRQTLLGYAMGESRGTGVTKVDCLVSLVLSIGAKEQLRALGQLRDNITEVKENLESRIETVGIRITGLQRGWKGTLKKLLAFAIFLALVITVCGLMLFPNSPYVKHVCQKDSIPGHSLSFTFYPKESDETVEVHGLEFKWNVLMKKLKLKFDRMGNKTGDRDGYRYFMNKERCETGGMRAVASWLDPSPKIPKVNVLAVNSNCSTVYYNGNTDRKWIDYNHKQVGSIHCKP